MTHPVSMCFSNVSIYFIFQTYFCVIPGLDPARPLVENTTPDSFRLTRKDADIVQIIQTNAGRLGQISQTGTLNYCVNGGRDQPYCKGHSIRK